jgi:hypothetical protein
MSSAHTSTSARDVLSPREVAARAGFSYHAILRAIRRGDLEAFEPVPGHYRVPLEEYERWLHTPARSVAPARARRPSRSRFRSAAPDTGPASLTRLTAIESGD